MPKHGWNTPATGSSAASRCPTITHIDSHPGTGAGRREVEMNNGILAGCRVYVVEDNYLLAMSVSDFLESAGAKVLGVTGKLAEAQHFVTEHDGDIDAVVLD